MTETTDDWCINCSDDEKNDSGDYWEPSTKEIIDLYNIIETKGYCTLNWKNLGYRAPSPVNEANTPNQNEIVENSMPEESDFDFKDEMSSPSLRKWREGETELKGSAKKKTTSLDSVLSNMRRHFLLQQRESQNPD